MTNGEQAKDRREELASRKDSCERAWDAAFRGAREFMVGAMREWIDRHGFGRRLWVPGADPEWGVTVATTGDKLGRSEDVSVIYAPVREARTRADGGRERCVTVSVRSTMLSASRQADLLMAEVAGELAKSLGEIEKTLSEYGWGGYDTVRAAVMDARRKLREFDDAANLARLAPGAKVLRGMRGTGVVECRTKECVRFRDGESLPTSLVLGKLSGGVWTMAE